MTQTACAAVRAVLLALLLAVPVTAFAVAVRAPADAQDNQPTAPAEDESGDVNEADLLVQGRELYETSCVSCHGPEGEGLSIPGGVTAPNIQNVGELGADFMLRTGRMPLAQPAPQSPEKPPAYTDSEIRALVRYVGSLGDGPPIPDVDTSSADLVNGGDLFRANCQPCHNASAIGGALSYGNHAPSLQGVEATQVVEAMRFGPGQMPQFGEDIFSDDEANDIAAYVEYLHDPADPGGAGLGHSGPTAEGFVAWFVAIPAAILAVRWITSEHRRPASQENDDLAR
jgi:ubiquinol-cytochrome c reductase cytochrome c subunit